MPVLDPMSHFSTPPCSKNPSKELFPFLFLLSRTHPARLSHPRTHGHQCSPSPDTCRGAGPTLWPHPFMGAPVIWLLRNLVSGVPSSFTPTHVGGEARLWPVLYLHSCQGTAVSLHVPSICNCSHFISLAGFLQ